MSEPKELGLLPVEKIRAVFTDLDETLTENGLLAPETYGSICRLVDRGYPVVIVTGRPAGWADCLIRLCPLHAVVYESGAGMLIRHERSVELVDLAEKGDRKAQRALLQDLFELLKKRIPHLRLAGDQAYRLSDFAIDYAEDPQFLSREELQDVLGELGREPRITAQMSSAHVNYWYGKHTKATACRHWLETEGKTRGISREQVLYCGDAPNDEPLFELFELTIGVANVRKYLPGMKHRPAYITRGNGGSGFQELVKKLVGS